MKWSHFGAIFSLASGILLSLYAIPMALPSLSLIDKIQETLKLAADWQLSHMPKSLTQDFNENETEPSRVCRRPFGLSYAAMADCSSMA
jgi:hypothetical protein